MLLLEIFPVALSFWIKSLAEKISVEHACSIFFAWKSQSHAGLKHFISALPTITLHHVHNSRCAITSGSSLQRSDVITFAPTPALTSQEQNSGEFGPLWLKFVLSRGALKEIRASLRFIVEPALPHYVTLSSKPGNTPELDLSWYLTSEVGRIDKENVCSG